MCVIIDTNCLSAVFDATSIEHNEFIPIKKWILSGKGKLIFGGTKYREELKKNNKCLKIISLLHTRTDKVVIVDNAKVDKEQERIKGLINNKNFDDPHLPAIVIISKCRIICSHDMRSVKFVTNRAIYPKGFFIPKYYTGIKNKRLLCDKYIDDCYKPLSKCKKNDADDIQALIG